MSSRTPAAFGDASDLVDVGLKSGHAFEGEPGEAVVLEVVEVRNLVDEDLGTSGECDQVVIHCRVARKDHRSVGGVETEGQGGVRVPVAHGDGQDPHDSVVEHGDGISRGPVVRLRNLDVDCAHEGPWVRHVAVQGHDVEVIGVPGENVVDQVRRPGKGTFRVDGRLAMERRVTGGSDVRCARSIDADGRERTAGLFDVHPPRVQEHAREVTGVVDMEVAEEDSFQAREIEAGLGERGWRSPPAVDDEDSSVDDKG